MCETEYVIEIKSKDRLTQKAIDNLATIVGYASKTLGIDIEVKRIKEEKLFEFKGRVSEAP